MTTVPFIRDEVSRNPQILSLDAITEVASGFGFDPHHYDIQSDAVKAIYAFKEHGEPVAADRLRTMCADRKAAADKAVADKAARDAAALASPCATVSLAKADRRCRGWAILVRTDTALPSPDKVESAKDVPGPYLQQSGTDELFDGDALFKGEENHHAKSRGWSYEVVMRDPADGYATTIKPTAKVKAAIKAAILAGRCTLPVDALKGAGDCAALVRIVLAVRGGMTVKELYDAS